MMRSQVWIVMFAVAAAGCGTAGSQSSPATASADQPSSGPTLAAQLLKLAGPTPSDAWRVQ